MCETKSIYMVWMTKKDRLRKRIYENAFPCNKAAHTSKQAIDKITLLAVGAIPVETVALTWEYQ